MRHKKITCVVAFAAAALFSVMLSGCGKKAENTNILKGMELLEQYDYQTALESFEAAIVYKEDDQLLYRGEGLAYMGLGNYEEAKNAFLTSLSYAGRGLTQLEYDTNYYLAAAHMKLGEYSDAEQIYTAIIGLRKKEVDAYYLRACVFLKENRYEDAIADFEKAFSLEPDNLELVIDAYAEMQAAGYTEEGKVYLSELMENKEKSLKDSEKGMIYYYLEDYDNARIYLDSSLNGNSAETSLILGKTYEQLGDMNYAAVVYQTYLGANPPDAAIYNSLGICLMKQEKYSEALDAFEAGAELGDTGYLQELKYNLIVVNERLGNFASAKTMMDEYISTYPDDADAKREADFLSTR